MKRGGAGIAKDKQRPPDRPRRPGACPADRLRKDADQPQAEDVECEDAGVLLHGVVCGSGATEVYGGEERLK